MKTYDIGFFGKDGIGMMGGSICNSIKQVKESIEFVLTFNKGIKEIKIKVVDEVKIRGHHLRRDLK